MQLVFTYKNAPLVEVHKLTMNCGDKGIYARRPCEDNLLVVILGGANEGDGNEDTLYLKLLLYNMTLEPQLPTHQHNVTQNRVYRTARQCMQTQGHLGDILRLRCVLVDVLQSLVAFEVPSWC